MLSFGTGKSEDDDDLDLELSLRMIQLLEEHGWSFTLGRDPVLILIEIEEYLTNGDTENES